MINKLILFAKLIYSQKALIYSMAKREVVVQYVGSFLGLLWTVIHPLVMITVFWFVFSVGFKVRPVNDVPFIVWLAAGMSIWFLFSDIISRSTGAITGNANLIKKTIFPSQILPVVKLVSCLLTHFVFVFILVLLIVFLHLPIRLYFLQSIYYLICLVVLTIGISWAVSALNVFVRDVNHVIAVVLQVAFWATPVFWDINIMPVHLHKILKLNPVFYLVQGYRESFIYFVPFWHHPYQTVYFWIISIACFVTGAIIFLKLKPQFADVL